jgi:hypothetical protein
MCVQESADDLVKLYKRVSLDDDLDDQLRSQLLSQLSAGATSTLSTLRLVSTMIPPRVRRIRNFFLFASKRIWILFASYSHVSVYTQTPFLRIIRFIFASKYSHRFAYKY